MIQFIYDVEAKKQSIDNKSQIAYKFARSIGLTREAAIKNIPDVNIDQCVDTDKVEPAEPEEDTARRPAEVVKSTSSKTTFTKQFTCKQTNVLFKKVRAKLKSNPQASRTRAHTSVAQSHLLHHFFHHHSEPHALSSVQKKK